jgi:hypothetical protein
MLTDKEGGHRRSAVESGANLKRKKSHLSFLFNDNETLSYSFMSSSLIMPTPVIKSEVINYLKKTLRPAR